MGMVKRLTNNVLFIDKKKDDVMDTNEVLREIESLIESGVLIPLEKVRFWMNFPDLNVQSHAFDFLFEYPERLESPVDENETVAFFLRYLEQCLRDPVEGKHAHGRYMAGDALRAWFERLWRRRPETEHILISIRELLSRLCLEKSREPRDTLITSVLEHLFVDAEIVAFFESWKHDPRLAAAYEEAISMAF